jgi:hypothetical protein
VRGPHDGGVLGVSIGVGLKQLVDTYHHITSHTKRRTDKVRTTSHHNTRSDRVRTWVDIRQLHNGGHEAAPKPIEICLSHRASHVW